MSWCGHCVGSCFSADSPVSLPLVPPYHLCLSHLKGWLVPLLFSPFVLLTNVAALKGDDTKSGTEYKVISNFHYSTYVYR